MKSHAGFAITMVLTAVVAGGAGWFLSRADAEARITDLTARLDSLARERNEAVDQAELRTAEARVAREAAMSLPEAVAEPELMREADAMGAVTAGDATDEETLATPEERVRRVRELRAKIEESFSAGKGEAVVDDLIALAAIVPEGRAPAMELAVRVNEDVNGAGKLKLSQMAFYGRLGTPAVRDLMRWSLGNDSPAGFRVMATYSLPWVQSQDETIGQFTAALARESDLSVQQALVRNLGQMKDEKAETALSEILRDSGRPARLRAEVLTQLAETENEQVLRAIEDAARNDPDPTVMGAANAAMKVRNPPTTGFLITGTLPRSQAEAAGMKAGDILVSYNGRSARNLAQLRTASGGTENEEAVPVVVVRDGQEVTLMLRPGQMGVFGRDVQEK